MTWLTLAGPQAQAGTYSAPAYSTSGQVTVSGATNAVYPYTISPASGSTPGSVSGNGSARAIPDIHGNATSLSVVAAGSIIAKFTWQPASPGEHPPATVIIQQTVFMLPTVGASGNGVVTTDTFSDGLGHSGPNTINAILYTQQAPAADGSVSVTFTPSATIAGSSGTGSSTMTGGILITYRVSASPVVVNLTGTAVSGGPPVPVLDGNGNQQILVGQGCTSSLFSSGIPTTFSNYNWTVSGTTFQNWLPASSSNSQASFYDPGPGTQTNFTYHWYWNDQTQQTETVTCTATVTPPTGQGSSFSVTATQKVTVYVPTLNKHSNLVGAGYIAPYKSTYPLWMVAEPSASMKSLSYGEGSTWVTSVSMPSTPTFSGTGTYAYAQIIVPGATVTDTSGVSHSGPHNGLAGLDGTFPYLSDTYPADGRQYNDGDSPAIPVSDAEASEQLTDTFHTYIMFMPPGLDSKWVPLAVSLWLTNFNASVPSTGHWSDFPSTQTVGPVSLGYDFVPQNTFPSWTAKF